MNNEYIIVNKTDIQKRIEELKGYKDEPETTQLKVYEEILSQSTPLIPEIEKAFDAGHRICKGGFMYIPSKREYILNLKLK